MPFKGMRIFEGDEWRPLNAGHAPMCVVGRVIRVFREVRDPVAEGLRLGNPALASSM